ncbi:unnamed protein product [Lepidochelys olivacea]
MSWRRSSRRGIQPEGYGMWRSCGRWPPPTRCTLNACWKCQNPQMPDFLEERAGAGVGPARLQDV